MGLKLLSKYYSEFLIAIIRFEFRKGLLIISKKLKHYCAKEGIWKLSYPRMTSFFTWLIHEKLPFIVQSCPEVFCKKGVIRNFVKLIGKHLSQSLFFNKIAGLATLSKKRLWYRCFPVNFVKFLSTPFLQNTSGGCFCVVRGESKSLESFGVDDKANILTVFKYN